MSDCAGNMFSKRMVVVVVSEYEVLYCRYFS